MAMVAHEGRAPMARWRQHWRQRWDRLWAPCHGLYLALPAHWPVQADEPAALAEALQAFETWCEAHPGARCELALGAAATLWQVVQHEQADLDQLAQAWDTTLAQWAHYLDVDLRQPEVLADWHLQEAHARGYSLLAATPLALSAGLIDVAQRHGVRLQWLGPWWVRGLAVRLARMAQPPAQDDAVGPAQHALILSEPGWAWRAHLQCRDADARRGRSWLRPSPWVLSQLEVDGGVQACSGRTFLEPHTSVVQLQAPGVPPDRAVCVGVELSVLQGLAPVWSPAWVAR